MRQNGGDVFSPRDTARDIARLLFATLTESQFAEVLKIGRELQQQQAALMREATAEARKGHKVLRGNVETE